MASKRLIIFDKDTGLVEEILENTDGNRSRPLKDNQSIAVASEKQPLASTPDITKDLFVSNTPENAVFSNTPQLTPGPISYDIPKRLATTHNAMGKIILGGQHSNVHSLDGEFVQTSTRLADYNFYAWNHWIRDLKLEIGDNFQLLNLKNNIVDGIYKVKGYEGGKLRTLKVAGFTTGQGISGQFSISAGTFGSPVLSGAIRLQSVDGSQFGLSASVDGCGVYQFNETVEQSFYKVTNNGGVKHDTSVARLGAASAIFSGGNGTTGPQLTVPANSGFSTDGASKYYYKLDTFVKFDGAPSADAVLAGKVGDAASIADGSYYLKYESSPSSFVFNYSTTASSTDFNKSLSTGSLPSGVTLTEWTHVQVEFGDLEGRIFVDGKVLAVQALGTTEEIFSDSSTHNFVLGADGLLQNPFKGYLDETHLVFAKASESGATAIFGRTGDLLGTTAAGSTLAVGFTIPVPATKGSTGGTNTKLLFKMDGIHNCESFTEDGINVAEASVQSYDHDRRVMFISDYGFTGSITEFSPSTTKGLLKGYNIGAGITGACAGVTGNSLATRPIVAAEIGRTADGLTLSGMITTLGERSELQLLRDLLGNPMFGQSGARGDFTNLFAGNTEDQFGTGGTGSNGTTVGPQQSLRFFASEGNLNRIQEANDLIGVCSGLSGDVFYFNNAEGKNFGIYGYELSDLLIDVITFRNFKRQSTDRNISDVKTATSLDKLSISGKTKSVSVKGKSVGIQAQVGFQILDFGGG